MTWPDSLVKEIAERRCIIFLGAGVSAGCSNSQGQVPPTWYEFLKNALDAHVPADDKPLITQFLAANQYLDAAEIIFSHIDAPEIHQYYRKTFLNPDFKYGELQEVIRDLDSKIVITTNYDKIYENSCQPQNTEQGFITKRYYDDSILDEVRSQTRLILKAHGCVTEPQKAILTRSQYFEAKKNYPAFYSLLDSLFLVNTILFIGCGLNDPDIQLILENSNISVPSNHPHYAVMAKGKHKAIIESFKKSYNIKFLEYDCPIVDGKQNHSELLVGLKELRDLVATNRAIY